MDNKINRTRLAGAKRGRGTLALVLAVAAGAAAPVASWADGYLAYNVGSARYTEDDLDKTVSLSSQYLTAGWMMQERLGLELRVGKTGDKEINVYGTAVEFSAPSMMGLYLRPVVPLNESLSLYASLGVSRVKRRATVDSWGMQIKVEETDSSLSGGVGIQMALGTKLMLNAEYMSWLLAKDVTLHGVTAGAGIRF